MEVGSVLITGANRGIGLEFVRQFIQIPNPPRFVFATYRSEDKAQTLKDLQKQSKISQVVLIKLDITNPTNLREARCIIAEKVGDIGLTLLINNAGVSKPLPFPQITEENLNYHFTTNTVGPIMLFQMMLPLLQRAAARKPSSKLAVSRAAVLNISSMVGSITRTGVEFLKDLAVPGYKISKAALNMSMRVIASNVKEQGILVVMMCPGWVKTDMGTEHAEITAEESISTILKTLQKLDDSHHGAYMDRFGKPYSF
ncbi:C-factor-like [Uloborus diversus]|uniref:C-factor-like n=1 Tax=Uloborus diversus TaxID=327109 RepID=UPI00240A25F4|nr:C-factor-like [Uloborus diversus]